MAFLSYAHEDSEDAAWLHESLEQFRVPAGLVGKLTEQGPVPRRLTPIFRDRHELAAGDDLKDDIEAALAGSRFLIVLCSPHTAQSEWTNREIITFKRLHGETGVFAVIVSGEPYASDSAEQPEQECFPAGLRMHYDRRGRKTGQRAEPIAADLREGGDGRRLGLLKIVAGMLGVGLDELAQRESHRRQRRLAWLSAASLAGMLVTSGLAVTAIRARDDAREQRREAEGLIGFMVGDLRTKLEPLGRLDVLDSVGARALAYYEKQDKSGLSNDSLAQRSKALTLIGEMANTRGNLNRALDLYLEARASTAELVKRDPDNPKRIFDHAQNVYWVGYIDYQRGNMGRALAGMHEYRRLAQRMIALAPNDPNYRLEEIYADTNIGTMLGELSHYGAAANVFQGALDRSEQLVATRPGDPSYRDTVSETLAWLADFREYSGQLDEAIALRTRQLGVIQQLWSSTGDVRFKRSALASHAALARLRWERGDLPKAIEESRQAEALGDQLIKTEPNNTEWIQAIIAASLTRAGIAIAAGDLASAAGATHSACALGSGLLQRDQSVARWRTRFRLECQQLRGQLALRRGDAAEAAAIAGQQLSLARVESNATQLGFNLATAESCLADALRASNEPDAAAGADERALAAWPAKVEETPRQTAAHALLLRRTGHAADAAVLINQLAQMGFREPQYLKELRQGG